jgi:hypothetical protein
MQLSRKLQEVVEAVSSDREALTEAVAGLSDNQLDYKPAEGDWSISDLLHHLALSDEANVKLTGVMLKQAEEKKLPPDPSPDESVLGCLDGFTETLGAKVKAPDRVAPRSHLPAPESLARLSASREQLMKSLAQLAAYDLSLLTWPHPFLGPLNMYQWLMMAGRHERRHTAQIERIKSSPGFPAA